MSKTIGILGGMSPESTAPYYQIITRKYLEKFGNFDYPEIIIFSVRHQRLLDWRSKGKYDLIIEYLSDSCRKLQLAGAEFIIIATNTMHYFLPDIKENVSIPFLSIVDVVGDAINKENKFKVGLLGTKYTMSGQFYKEGLKNKGIDVVVPTEIDQDYINNIIFTELEKNKIYDESRKEFLRIINYLQEDGAEGIILGCTEIPLLINQKDTDIKLFDTLLIHAEAALNFALDINK